MINSKVPPRRPVVEADATSDNVTLTLPPVTLAPPIVVVLRLDASGNTVTIKDAAAATITTVPASGVVLVSPEGSSWTVVGAYPSAGSGTVTTVSVTTANGISGTVANPTTTPAISLDIAANSQSVNKIAATATDKLFGRSTAGAGAGEEITCTAAGRAILDDADAVAQRATLGVVNTLFQSGGAQAIKLDDLAAPDNNTDLDVSITAHGLCPIAPNDSAKFLDGTGAWTTPAGGSGLSQAQVLARTSMGF